MAEKTRRRVAFVSTFPPRKCGIATFTQDLITNISKISGSNFEPIVIAMQSDNQIKYDDPVKFEIRRNVKNDYICAADFINFSDVDVVSVQHEFGLFGGDAGSYLNILLDRLNAPVISTLHTVLKDPEPDYYKSMTALCNASYKIVTMNTKGIEMLREIYGIDEKKIELIPHGIPDLPFVDNNYYKHKYSMEGRKTILTFGLLSKNKGIEFMLEAMPKVVEAEPSVMYLVLGMTHPLVAKEEGESYRFKLQQRVKELGLENNVKFINRFVDDDELGNFLCASDIYVTPYMNEEQLTSGTLSFAVGTGKAVVSTPYWAAKELLDEGRGIIVDFGDTEGLADSIIKILQDDRLFYTLRRKAYDYGRSRTWPKIGKKYWKLFSQKLPICLSHLVSDEYLEAGANMSFPEPSLKHIKHLTDDTGIMQHCKYTVPNRSQGYCTDDNARAAMAMLKYHYQHPDSEALKLLDIYLSFLLHSQRPNGKIRNLMRYDRSWIENEPQHDALGRFLWALGNIIAAPPSKAYVPILKDYFDRTVNALEFEHPRVLSYAILGMFDYLIQFPGASEIKRQMQKAADFLIDLYESNSEEGWEWFLDKLTYDNAIIPYALFVVSMKFPENTEYFEVAEKSCGFLLKQTYREGHFSFIGCNGWYKKGHVRAQFDQQPIEAASTIMMLRAAYDSTKNIKYLKLQRKAFDWFLGDNDRRIPVYNFKTKGCHDGLMRGGLNQNQGAEAMLSFTLSLVTVIESYALKDENQEQIFKSRVPIEQLKNKSTSFKRPSLKSLRSQKK